MSEKVHLRVGEGRKEKWDTHATEDHADKYGSLSALIRHAVESQIERDAGDATEASHGAQPVEANGRIDDIKTGVEDNGKTLESIQGRLVEIQDTLVSQGGIPDRVFSAVYGAIPMVEHGTGTTDKNELAQEFGAKAPEIAEEAGVSMRETSKALAELYHEYDDVEMLMTDEYDAPRYWRHQ